jgi:hypothetical protein
MQAISDLPMLHDIDADYTPQYVKLARIIRIKIESGDLGHLAPLPAASLAIEYGVSVGMLAANRYVTRTGSFTPYHVSWQAGQ